VRYLVERMTLADIPRIVEIEKLAYSSPWPSSAYRKELQDNRYAHYIVIRDTATLDRAPAAAPPPVAQTSRRFPLSLLPRPTTMPTADHGLIVGFAGLWLMIDEAHITTIANHPDYRGRGVGELLLNSLIGIAHEVGARRVTLEVRVSNGVAQSLYSKYGFAVEGRRRRYYSDNHEDAFNMGTPPIHDPSYRARFVALHQALMLRLEAADRTWERERQVTSPGLGRGSAGERQLPPAD
jgi:[ribosomal protein S18]-alanine N-acetyltransferase